MPPGADTVVSLIVRLLLVVTAIPSEEKEVPVIVVLIGVVFPMLVINAPLKSDSMVRSLLQLSTLIAINAALSKVRT